MRAFVETLADYDTTLYYCSEAYGFVYQNGVEIGDLYAYDEGGGGYQACVGRAMAETYYPYDPSAEYDIESFHEVDVILYQTYLEYYDYYNYIEYTYGEPVIFPNNFAFVGLGPPQVSSVRDILLGTVTGVFTAGAVAGEPHHVRVVSDDTLQSCSVKDRRIVFQVVDSSDRRTGSINVREQFLDAQYGTPVNSVYNSCRDFHYSPGGCLQTDAGPPKGRFTDRLWVGCPTVSGDCGFSPIISQWRWCRPRGMSEVPLTTNRYETRRNSVLINGKTWYAPGTQLF